MKESHGKDLASHPDPESCAGGREVTGEALTGAHAGQPSSREIKKSGVPTPLTEAEGNIVDGVIGKPYMDPSQMVRQVGRRRSVTIRPACTPMGSRTVA